MVPALMTLLVAGIAWLIFLWKKGNKKLAITIWIIIGIWFVSSIVYDEMRKHPHSPSIQSKTSNRLGLIDDAGVFNQAPQKNSAHFKTGQNPLDDIFPNPKPASQQTSLPLDVIDPYYTVANSRTKLPTRAAYVEKLNQLVPDLSAIRDNTQFSQFLSKVDPITGKTLYALAKEADDNFDAYRVASFYLSFKRISTAGK